MARKINLPRDESPPHMAMLKRSIRPVRNQNKEIYKIIYLKKSEGKQRVLDKYELESQAWFREMRQQEEDWLSVHIPIRDAVFKEHEETFELASASSKAALEELEKCDETTTKYYEMKDDFTERVAAMNRVHQEKFNKDVI